MYNKGGLHYCSYMFLYLYVCTPLFIYLWCILCTDFCSFTCIIIVHVFVLCPKMAPLEAVHWTQVPFLPLGQTQVIQEFPRPVCVPDVDSFLAQLLPVGATLHKPQQLLRNTPPENPLSGQQWEGVSQVVPGVI